MTERTVLVEGKDVRCKSRRHEIGSLRESANRSRHQNWFCRVSEGGLKYEVQHPIL